MGLGFRVQGIRVDDLRQVLVIRVWGRFARISQPLIFEPDSF